MLYYSSNPFFPSIGDIRITYYKLKTEDKISVIGEKKGNEIVPKMNLPDSWNKPIFKSLGDIYYFDEFIELFQDEIDSSFNSYLKYFLIFSILGSLLIYLGLKYQ
jgi:hypothetical protein